MPPSGQPGARTPRAFPGLIFVREAEEHRYPCGGGCAEATYPYPGKKTTPRHLWQKGGHFGQVYKT